MTELARLAAASLEATQERAKKRAETTLQRGAILAVAAFFFSVAMVFFAYAAFVALAADLGAVGAALLVGAIFLLIAAVTILAALLLVKKDKKTVPATPSQAALVHALAKDAEKLGGPWVAVAALVAGFMATRR